MTSASISLFYGGQLYTDWLGYDVTNDLRRPAGSFRLQVRPPSSYSRQVVEPGNLADLRIDGQTVLWGRVERVQSRSAADRRVMELSGWDAGGLLREASADVGWTWSQAALATIASTVAAYAGLIRTPQVDEAITLDRVQIEAGESCWDLLARLAQAHGQRIWVEPSGLLHIGSYTTSGQVTNWLGEVSGFGVTPWLQAEVVRSTENAFSELAVLGQYDDGTGHARFRGEWTDLTYPFSRPRVVVDHSIETPDDATARATELGTAARASRLAAAYTVRGHLAPDGSPWAPNTLVWTADPDHGIDEALFVMARRFRDSDSGGRTTALDLVRPEDLDG